MNKFTFLSALSLLLLASCQVISFDDDDNDAGTTKGEKTMHFRLTTYKMTNIDELPDGNTDDDGYDDNDEDDGYDDDYDDDSDYAPSYSSRHRFQTIRAEDTHHPTRAASKDVTDHLLLAIYDDQGHLVDTIAYQDKDDATLPSYGTFTHTLHYGKYTLLALGWNSTQQCTVHRPDSISFSEGWAPHTFLCRQNIVVSESYSDTRSISLRRCVAKFSLSFNEYKDKTIPQDLSDFVIRISGAGSTLDSETRHCASLHDVTRTVAVATPANVRSLTSYCFLPTDSTGLTINVTARDAEGNTLAERTFEDVPMKINYETRYTGSFFPYGSTGGTIEVDTDYDGEILVEF